MSAPLKIGLIGLDTSHVVAFTKIFNDASYEFHLPGAKVTHAYAGGSPDLDVSINRVAGFTETLSKDFGVKILPTPEAVAKEVDLIFITAVDARVHRELFEKTASFGKPTFIDKPFAATLEDAQAMAKLANEKNITLTTCSSLRFSDKLAAALDAAKSDDPVLSVYAYGPMNIQPQMPGLLWYGVHAVEMIIRVMGPGCTSVQATTNQDQDVITGQWADGRLAVFHGMRGGHNRFGMLIHRKSGVAFVDATAYDSPWYHSMLSKLIPAFQKNTSAVPMEDSMAVMEFIDAANRSREDGQRVAIGPVSVH